jgi:hypothetical protein
MTKDPRRVGRRRVLQGAAALGVAGPALWNAVSAAATATVGPRWIAFGAKPTTSMIVQWSTGTAGGNTPRPPAPQIRWGLTAAYGSHRKAGSTMRVTPPSGYGKQPPQNAYYNAVNLQRLTPATTYHYSVSDDGNTWSPDARFTTAPAEPTSFRFTAYGDQATLPASSLRMMSMVAALKPALHLQAGDLSYATPIPEQTVDGYKPAYWDDYLAGIGARAAYTIPWESSVGAHEVEPLGPPGYVGYWTRFRQAYDTTSGSPVVHTYTYGNVAFIHLDTNDVSAQATLNRGYTGGKQTAWLGRTLAAYRAQPTIDFIVVVCAFNCYSSNVKHGSDGGVRDAWVPLFDQYSVDLVISGHVHAYERTNPMRGNAPTAKVATGGSTDPSQSGTTYICSGTGGNDLYDTWYGTADAGDPGSSTAPKVYRWTGNGSRRVTDSVTGYSAFRRAMYSTLVVDVVPPGPTGKTTMTVRAVMPAQDGQIVTSITKLKAVDKVVLTRQHTP